MSRDTSLQSGEERRLTRAISHCGDYWLPVNRTVLKKLRAGLASGKYEDGFDLLVNDLQQDLSLFTHCFKEVLTVLNDEGVSLPSSPHPTAVFEQAGLEQLRQILESDLTCLSPHKLSGGNEMQLCRVHETLMSASAAHTLAEKFNVPGDVAHGAALLRQFGISLIAWNYPTVYQEVMTSLEADTALDEALARKLGFSPTMLAVRMLGTWGLTKESCENLGLVDPTEEETMTVADSLAASLSEMCKVGEALARAHHPEIYPQAKHDWEFARQEVHKHLGPEGIAKIREYFELSCELYLWVAPEIFEGEFDPETAPYYQEQATSETLPENPYLHRCEAGLQHKLRALYAEIATDTKRSTRLIRMLIDEVTPEAGITGGCIYTADLGIMVLIPQTDFGSLRLRKLGSVDYSIVQSGSDMVAVAFQSSEPVVAYRTDSHGTHFAMIAGVFGRSDRAGVFYTELPLSYFDKPEIDHTGQFKALVYALNDTLGLT